MLEGVNEYVFGDPMIIYQACLKDCLCCPFLGSTLSDNKAELLAYLGG